MDAFVAVPDDARDFTGLPALAALRKELGSDHGLIDKSSRAFVSFVQFYATHDCSVIFQLKGVNLGRLANGFGLLKLPKMPELKRFGAADFVPSTVDVNRVPYRY
jgi:ATP-dependent RNA helicase DDX55/SPB4